MAGERLQKVLSSRGVASRRAAEQLIRNGVVTVNGNVAELGQSVDPVRDEIRVDGQLVADPSPACYIALHKPTGYVTSTASERGERTVMDLIGLPGRLYPVGRLDADTAGLLLLTSDGEWGNIVTHPRYEIEKEYVAVVRGHPSAEQIAVLSRGVRLITGEDTSAATVAVVHRSETTTTLTVTVHEGKKRQIRLMMAAIGHPVVKLTRVRVGPIRLGWLTPGEWRNLSDGEVEGIREAAKARVGPSDV